ncbi:phytanoyl-CoA dioxygenase family protein [Actinopolymorpha rutila]|uniref:Ectoine hydroxylase-related dioxygenase (Phytanoyl-CoA dioxygenase family) n=1 Tax=Actinopolymorpha rutila TaxID=446787 RepID=A0A852ZK13_9ACTN|nr:phytanoyl-CoA dioxygenase family protein [Actinopolymorpha rutila]NYH93324.1 ectoine hydroxylase-related dioxygenase (phytanoyl-CoA dioxygenase family) [Actinopolymorpha rutila]
MTSSPATELSTAYTLPTDARTRFAEDGFVRLRGVLSPDTIAAYEPEITGKVIELNTMHLPMAERSTYSKAFLQVGGLWKHSRPVAEFVFSSRLAKIAADLMGVDGVRLYHDQALYKEVGGGITPFHADQYYWPFSSDKTCTVWVPLQDTPLGMGPLSFSVGSQRFSHGRDLPISDHSEEELQKVLGEQGLPLSQEPYALGDVSFHSGWTFHRAEPNTTDVPRRVMTIIYMDADIVIHQPVNDAQRNDLAEVMPGKKPGDVPDTPVNPVLYRR